jgi:hypothetical protein
MIIVLGTGLIDLARGLVLEIQDKPGRGSGRGDGGGVWYLYVFTFRF